MTLDPGATIGIIGGGQLGRMLALAALDLGFRVHVYAPPEADNVAFAAANATTEAAYDDAAALAAFAQAVDVITFEFENVPVAPLKPINTPIAPPLDALAVSQDRLTEKAFLARCGLAVARHAAIDNAQDLENARRDIPNGILKTRRLGYDGKGQARVGPDDDAQAARESLGGGDLILEERIAFVAETSVVLVRGADGDVAAYATGTNTHENGILRETASPSPLDAALEAEAIAQTRAVAEELQYVGVIAVEFFVTGNADTPLIANEMAPRVHNTGHWTMDGAQTSQFENHIRAVAGWPLGATTKTASVTMRNILGDEALLAHRHLCESGAKLHLYGKRSARRGRKMGHVNFIA